MSWMNFSDAEEQSSSDLIPHKTPVKVVMKIRAGGYNDPAKGWVGGYATQADSGAVYLDCEFTVIGGKYGKRKVWSLIGLHSPKGPKWEGMGRSFLRAALESARNIVPTDMSDLALKARTINGFGDLDGLEFAAFVEVQKAEAGTSYSDKNVIQTVIPCTHKDYSALMSGQGAVTTTPTASASVSQMGRSTAKPAGNAPAWAS
jgi:hypothetical protein